MCGLTGFVNLNGDPASSDDLQRMTRALAHRGPDGEGIWTDGPVGLGHRRLAIIDLTSAGQQPMFTADQRFAIAYVGEVYNFQELRSELEGLGFQFRSRTDTEVVLAAWACWGPDCLPRFNGMFAFAIWDRLERKLHLARDRYGIKPLYYAEQSGAILFGSEIKSFIGHPRFRVEMDEEALLEYFTFQNFFTDKTLFRTVRTLPAGSRLTVDVGGNGVGKPTRYWDYDFNEPSEPASDEEYLEELDRLFRQAVTRQLISDVPVSSYLSGGIDSGSITAIAASEQPNLNTFTVGFDIRSASGMEIGFDERERAEYMSYLFRTQHYQTVLKAGDMERVLPRLMWHLEEPRVGQSYPNFSAAHLASRFGKVILSGAGGDELFGGYPWRYYRASDNQDFEEYVDHHYRFWQRLIPNRTLKKVFAPIEDKVSHVWTRDVLRDVFQHHAPKLTRPEDFINHSLYFEARTFLHGLLIMEDKLSMAHGLETRVPFLDNDLADFAQRLPVRLKLGNLGETVRLDENQPGSRPEQFFNRTRDGKQLLRKVMQRYVPDEVAQGTKQGFSGPDASWFRGESMDYVRSCLMTGSPLLYEFLDRREVERLLADHFEGRENRRLLIWSLLCVEHWCKIFLQGQTPEPVG